MKLFHIVDNMPITKLTTCSLLMSVCLTPLFTSRVCAQDASGTPEEMLTLSLPDTVELGALIDFVSESLELNIVYDTQISSQAVRIHTPAAIHRDALLPLLDQILSTRQLALRQNEANGIWQIISSQRPGTIASVTEGDDLANSLPFETVSHVFVLQHVEAAQLQGIVQSLLNQGGQAQAIQGQPLLLVTDKVERVQHVAQILSQIDLAQMAPVVAFRQIEHRTASEVMAQLSGLLNTGQAHAGQTQLHLSAFEDSNQLVLVGTAAQIAFADTLLSEVDIDLGLYTHAYRLTYTTPEQINRLMAAQLNDTQERQLYHATPDNETGMLVVRGTENIHRQIDELIAVMDVAANTAVHPVQFYPLAYADAQQVFATLSELESLVMSTLEATPQGEQARGTQGRSQRLGMSVERNAIIVVGPPDIQSLYAPLIAELDQPQAQVLLECTIVAIDFSNADELGIDIGIEGFNRILGEGAQNLTFTQFGLSTADTTTGRLTPLAGAGANGALLSAGLADVVLRALQTETRARIVASPRLLVNNGQTGSIESINRVPFLEINSTETVTTTTGSGTAQAGVTANLTPRITDGDQLSLAFRLGLSSFTGAGSSDLPPPSQENAIESTVTIPDGATIVVGGLQRRDERNSVRQVPLLGDIPLLEHLFQRESTETIDSTLFVFIKPMILRDQNFVRLQAMSDVLLEQAMLPMNVPMLEPVWAHQALKDMDR